MGSRVVVCTGAWVAGVIAERVLHRKLVQGEVIDKPRSP